MIWNRRFVLGVTGASGAIYAARLLHHLRSAGNEVHLVASRAGEQVSRFEGHPLPEEARPEEEDLLPGPLVRHRDDDLWAAPASGSFRHGGMVIAPCSAGTVGRLAAGTGETLLLRAADVCLKEGLPLILLVREAPLSLIHLRNLERLAEAGARIVPASPGFYSRPAGIEELVDGLLQRVLDLLGLDLDIAPRWREPENFHV
jgi:4-hydroxy-3-polyprenylbenzoate decarboxylase